MFNKFRIKNPDIGVFLAFFLFVLFSPIIILLEWVLTDTKEQKLFKENYSVFLREHEGEEFFCYTNRKTSELLIEKNIIPNIDKSIHVVKLIGKTTTSELDQKYISHALYNIKNFGFPNVMKIVDGKLIDYSLHKHVYNAINTGKVSELKALVDEALLKLRT